MMDANTIMLLLMALTALFSAVGMGLGTIIVILCVVGLSRTSGQAQPQSVSYILDHQRFSVLTEKKSYIRNDGTLPTIEFTDKEIQEFRKRGGVAIRHVIIAENDLYHNKSQYIYP